MGYTGIGSWAIPALFGHPIVESTAWTPPVYTTTPGRIDYTSENQPSRNKGANMTTEPTDGPPPADEEWDLYKAGMTRIATLAAALADDPDLDRMARTLTEAETLGPIMFPTEYNDGGSTRLYEQKRIVDAVLTVRRVVQDFRKGQA